MYLFLGEYRFKVISSISSLELKTDKKDFVQQLILNA